jgi:hypothetical protein
VRDAPAHAQPKDEFCEAGVQGGIADEVALTPSLITVLLAGASAGCAIQYRNPKSGREHLIGLGQISMTKPGETVAASTTAPGLCISIADDKVGISLGWTVRERIYFRPDAPTETPWRQFGLAWSQTGSSLWGIGWLRMRTPPSKPGPQTLASASAVAGFGFGVETGLPAITLGLTSKQYTQMATNNTVIEIDQPRAAWPGFDFLHASTRIGPYLTPNSYSP